MHHKRKLAKQYAYNTHQLFLKWFKHGYVPKPGLLSQVITVMAHANNTSVNETQKPSQSKYLRYRILGVCPAPTDSAQMQGAGRLGLPPAPLGSPPHVFPASPRGTLALLWEAQRAEEAGWQWAATSYPNTQAWSWNVHARSHTHPCTHTQIYGACTDTYVHKFTNNTHRIPLFLYSCFTLQRCEIQTHCMPGI